MRFSQNINLLMQGTLCHSIMVRFLWNFQEWSRSDSCQTQTSKIRKKRIRGSANHVRVHLQTYILILFAIKVAHVKLALKVSASCIQLYTINMLKHGKLRKKIWNVPDHLIANADTKLVNSHESEIDRAEEDGEGSHMKFKISSFEALLDKRLQQQTHQLNSIFFKFSNSTKADLEEIKESWQFLSKKFDDLVTEVKDLCTENDNLRSSNLQLSEQMKRFGKTCYCIWGRIWKSEKIHLKR